MFNCFVFDFVVNRMLYRLLEKRNFYKSNPKVLILFNKKDLLTSNANTFELLEQRKKLILNEFNKLRESYSTLQSISSGKDETQSVVLGTENQPLTWDDMQCPIDWGICSVKKGQLDDVQSFLEKL